MKYLFPDGKRKAVTLSYDDGQVFDEKLIDILNTYGLKGTFNLNSLYSLNVIGAEKVKKLYAGHEIACHGAEHRFLNEITPCEMTTEIMQDRIAFEKLLGRPVRGMAYAFGVYNDNVKRTLASCGIRYCRTVNATHDFYVPEDFLAWNPTCHHDDSLSELTDRFLNGWLFHELPVFYVWGHSFEFDRNNNWNVMEDFAKKISGHDNIWYATNIEIYDYVTAVRSLEVSADGKGVFNPSALPVWVSFNNKTYRIDPRKFKRFR